MKKVIAVSLACLIFIACKKNNSQTPKLILPDVVGTWTLYSCNGLVPGNNKVTADEYPCISNNQLIFNQDNTVTATYIGKDSCHVTPGTGQGATVIGLPGQKLSSFTWYQNGDKIYYDVGYSVLSTLNNKPILTHSDTIIVDGKVYYQTTVNVKL